MDVSLSEEQQQVFAVMESTAQHIFLTGRAGTGKSTLLRYFMENTSKRIAVLAPTGVAALLVGGQTIHSFFRLPIGIVAQEDLWQPEELRQMLRKVETIVIDEVSMVSADLMDAIDRALRQARHIDIPFGGVQMVLIGDPYQLSPVPPRSEAEREWYRDNYQSLWFFDAKVWERTGLFTHELHFIHRQDEDEFKSLLNAVRHGLVTAEQAQKLNTMGAREVPNPRPITLATTNHRVTSINNRELSALAGAPLLAAAEVSGDFGKHLPAEAELELKIDAQVMFLRNDPDQRWVNGTTGRVTKISENVWVEIDGTQYEVEPVTWENIKYSYSPESRDLSRDVVGEFTQFPLRLAWAVTIHKSQGQSHEQALIDLGSGAFSAGQTYVALSRIRTLSGLYLSRPLRPSDVKVDAAVRTFMQEGMKL